MLAVFVNLQDAPEFSKNAQGSINRAVPCGYESFIDVWFSYDRGISLMGCSTFPAILTSSKDKEPKASIPDILPE